MRGVIKYALAGALLLATAMPAIPAMARSFVVCLDTTKDARFSTEATGTTPNFFVAAAPLYAGDTNVSAAKDCTAKTIGQDPVGTFFTFGGLVAGLPQSTPANPNDAFYVIWHFRVNGRGAFDTTGPTQTSPTYPQTIIGSTNPGLAPTHGLATVTNLANASGGTVLTFKITTREGNGGD